VVDKENGGKADALNAGINLARYPLFCAIDADSMLESDALLRAVQPFVESPERVVGVGGTIRIANGNHIVGGRVVEAALPRNPLVLVQIVEYLRAFLMARVALGEVEALMLISGAFGIFRRAVVIQAGGYSRDTVGEDLELVVKLHRYLLDQRIPLEIRFVPEPVCWTQAPTTLGGLMRQRTRWQRGALETYFRHIGMFLRPRYGRAGSLGMASVLLLDVMGPLIEVLGYVCIPLFWYLGMLNIPYMIAYLALTFGMGIFISVGSLVLEEMEMQRFKSARDLLVLTFCAICENFGYRQLHNIWRFIGWIQFLLGRTHWGTQKRQAFDGSDGGSSGNQRGPQARPASPADVRPGAARGIPLNPPAPSVG
jgi:cellulose synthase/poly-beta-1,6-N-acetylglucosamine synthase-like glycosyltransferase